MKFIPTLVSVLLISNLRNRTPPNPTRQCRQCPSPTAFVSGLGLWDFVSASKLLLRVLRRLRCVVVVAALARSEKNKPVPSFLLLLPNRGKAPSPNPPPPRRYNVPKYQSNEMLSGPFFLRLPQPGGGGGGREKIISNILPIQIDPGIESAAARSVGGSPSFLPVHNRGL